jgi:hypothetical protein
MMGPTCQATVCLDIKNMKDGDCAGFAAFNSDSGVLTIKKNGKKLSLEMSEQTAKLDKDTKAVTEYNEKVLESIALKQNKIWLRIDADFRPVNHWGTDTASLSYSLDGKNFKKLGNDHKMRFDWQRFFMGSKFAIFNYATKKQGGYVDVDCFNVKF